MGIKKIARPINEAKNIFVKWLKDNKADNIDVYEGSDDDNEWDYYRSVDAFVGGTLYSVIFMVWRGEVRIEYSDEENRYNNMSIWEFLELINN